ncbi:hypothetical protein OZZ08_02015 [Malaciobacter mytili]|uniref:hypothetical protein n=1 Tax=Malaciobacter mytili TaxID=603050 RepID=UPI003BAE2459
MKNYLFLTKDGFTYDGSNYETNNLQLLGTGVGNDILEAFVSFKYNQSYLLNQSFKDIFAVEYVGDFIMNLEL